MKYLAGYPASLQAQVGQWMAEDKLGAWLVQRYPQGGHEVQTDHALYGYVNELKGEYMRKAGPLSKVAYDSKLHVIRNALGTHTTISRVQGGKLKAKREIRVASLFKEVPEGWLRMIAVHELAHMKERDHNKAFYSLCTHMESDYHRLEFELRVYLTHLDAGAARLWTTDDHRG